MGIFAHSSRRCQALDVEGLARSLWSASSQACSVGLRPEFFAGQSSSSTIGRVTFTKLYLTYSFFGVLVAGSSIITHVDKGLIILYIEL